MQIKKLSNMFGEDTFLEAYSNITEVYLEDDSISLDENNLVQLSEGNSLDMSTTTKKEGVIGTAISTLSFLDGVSRNKRFYPSKCVREAVSNKVFQDRLKNRAIVGTIGHADKMVDEDDWNRDLISHRVSNISIDENKQAVVGQIEILDTGAGKKLLNMFKLGYPVYVSSRGAGKVAGKTYEGLDIVDKLHIHCWDVVLDPGFLQAKPELKKVSESKLYYMQDDKNNVDVEDTNKNKKANEDMKIDGVSAEDLIKQFLTPLKEEMGLTVSVVKALKEQMDVQKAEEEAKKQAEEQAKKQAMEEAKAKEEAELRMCKESLEVQVVSLKEENEKLLGELEEIKKAIEENPVEDEKEVEALLDEVSKVLGEKLLKVKEELELEKTEHEATKKLLEETLAEKPPKEDETVEDEIVKEGEEKDEPKEDEAVEDEIVKEGEEKDDEKGEVDPDAELVKQIQESLDKPKQISPKNYRGYYGL